MNEIQTEVIDGEIVEPSQELELSVAPAVPPTLFRTDDPVEVLARATEVANALAPAIEQRRLYATISNKKHVTVEGWTTLGAMLGVTPVCVWTRKCSDQQDGWEARVEARTLDGRVIGAAEAQCTRAERMWSGRDEYALRSMAQTRATSKALGSVLRFVITLAGYSGTPAEEMPGGQAARRQDDQSQQPRSGGEPTLPRADAKALVDRAWGVPSAKQNFRLALQHVTGADPGEIATKAAATKATQMLTITQADRLDSWIGRKESE